MILQAQISAFLWWRCRRSSVGGLSEAAGADGPVGFRGAAGRGASTWWSGPRAPRGPGGLRPDEGGAAEGREPPAFGRRSTT